VAFGDGFPSDKSAGLRSVVRWTWGGVGRKVRRCRDATLAGAENSGRCSSTGPTGEACCKRQKLEILIGASFRLRQSSYGATRMSAATKTGKAASIRAIRDQPPGVSLCSMHYNRPTSSKAARGFLAKTFKPRNTRNTRKKRLGISSIQVLTRSPPRPPFAFASLSGISSISW
jgi:hypothetical protein